MSNLELARTFFLQMAVILLVVRAAGKLAKRLGQPQVIGEMLAGIVLGPSVFGLLLPDWQARIFPPPTIGVIYVISQIGLVLFMFLVGVEFRTDLIRSRMRVAGSVSLAGILAPFTLGALLAFFLIRQPGIFPEGVPVWGAMLFLGAAMSITAFPVLARILQDRGLSGTSLGTLALGAAAIDDAVAWCLLAVLLASFSGNGWIALAAIGGGVLYFAAARGLVRPFLQRLGKRVEARGELRVRSLTLVLMMVMVGAFITDYVGIHAVFGAFILGTAMPRGAVRSELEQKLAPLVKSFLIPLFFVYSGLNTQLGLVAFNPAMLGLAGVVFLLACLGKGVACYAAARLSGESNREALGIGTLMNARGLTELIILNIGLERGVISPALFTVMVIMALATTVMTSPLFDLVYRRTTQLSPAPAVEAVPEFELES